jgi:hypothetical protein
VKTKKPHTAQNGCERLSGFLIKLDRSSAFPTEPTKQAMAL